jgi:hypothetical protein
MSGECHQTDNILCKHARATRTYYVDLDERLPAGVTASSPAAESEDETLEIELIEVISEDTTVGTADCSVNLLDGRAIVIQVSGGTATPDESETILTVSWEQSDGDNDAVDCRLMIGGSSGS